jgi:hypothetical protein
MEPYHDLPRGQDCTAEANSLILRIRHRQSSRSDLTDHATAALSAPSRGVVNRSVEAIPPSKRASEHIAFVEHVAALCAPSAAERIRSRSLISGQSALSRVIKVFASPLKKFALNVWI